MPSYPNPSKHKNVSLIGVATVNPQVGKVRHGAVVTFASYRTQSQVTSTVLTEGISVQGKYEPEGSSLLNKFSVSLFVLLQDHSEVVNYEVTFHGVFTLSDTCHRADWLAGQKLSTANVMIHSKGYLWWRRGGLPLAKVDCCVVTQNKGRKHTCSTDTKPYTVLSLHIKRHGQTWIKQLLEICMMVPIYWCVQAASGLLWWLLVLFLIWGRLWKESLCFHIRPRSLSELLWDVLYRPKHQALLHHHWQPSWIGCLYIKIRSSSTGFTGAWGAGIRNPSYPRLGHLASHNRSSQPGPGKLSTGIFQIVCVGATWVEDAKRDRVVDYKYTCKPQCAALIHLWDSKLTLNPKIVCRQINNMHCNQVIGTADT